MQSLWPASAFTLLERTAQGCLRPSDGWFASFLALPELALVAESCRAEIALHGALIDAPSSVGSVADLDALADADARGNYAAFIAFRDALLAAGSLEACYLRLIRAGPVTMPAHFVDRLVQAIVQHLLGDTCSVFEARAAELLFRPQCIVIADRRRLAADRVTLDLLRQTVGPCRLGRLPAPGDLPAAAAPMAVLNAGNAAAYWLHSDCHHLALDLTCDIEPLDGHGVHVTGTQGPSGLSSLARVLERWVAHLLGVQVSITPLQHVDDPTRPWHIGLDAVSVALLGDLWRKSPVDAARLTSWVGLFRLDFDHAGEMRADLAGQPVWLGLAATADGVLRLKPQNLLLNLPLACSM